jgi:glycosyltransferase involved in cell wall biosynthesis
VKISFCITCYDGDAHLLEQSLSTILQTQTTKPDEILVVSSGLKSLSCSSPNVKVYNFKNRMLAGGARNKGGELATGEVVCFCDVDDPIHPKKCEVIKRVFANQNVDALVHNYRLDVLDFSPIQDTQEIKIEKVTDVDERWEKEQHYIFNPHKDIPRTNVEVRSNKPVCHGHLSAKKELLAEIKYREDMWVGEDGDMLQAIVKSKKFDLYYTPLVLINYIT